MSVRVERNSGKKRHFVVYLLMDPETLDVRYVGQSSNGMSRARKPHRHGYCGYWVASLEKRNLRPVVRLLQEWETISAAELDAAEAYWISYFKEAGCRITNLTSGGEGSLGWVPSAETRRKISEANRGWKASPEQRERARLGCLGNPSRRGQKRSAQEIEKQKQTIATQKQLGTRPVRTEETRRKMSEAAMGRPVTAEARAKISAAKRGKKRPAHLVAALAESNRGRIQTEATREKRSESMRRAHAAKKENV